MLNQNGIVSKLSLICLAQVFFSFSTYLYNLWLLVVIPLCFTYSALISGKASCVKFGPDAKYLAVGSMDRNLRIFGLPSEDGPLES